MSLEESKDGEQETDKLTTLLPKRPKPKIDMTYRAAGEGGGGGLNIGKTLTPALINFANLPQKFAVWNMQVNISKEQTQKLWLQEDLPKRLRAELS